MNMIDLSILIDRASAKWKNAFPKMDAKIEQAAASAFLNARKPGGFAKRSFEVAVILSDDKTVKTLNHVYRDKDKPTNVLSFPQFNLRRFKSAALDVFPQKMPVPLGDVVLALETVRREAKDQKKPLESHVAHLVIHGVLHLLGYDHMNAKDAKSMEKLECDILDSLGYDDPYRDTVVLPMKKKTSSKRKTAAAKKKPAAKKKKAPARKAKARPVARRKKLK
jgi:probable rRNA maturation factor